MSGETIEIETFFGRCRCCLSYGYLRNMWSDHEFEGETEIYGEMLVQCFGLSWDNSEDSMEQDQICEQCICRLRDACDFKKVVLDSQEELLNRYNTDTTFTENEFSIKNEVEEKPYPEEDTADNTYADTEYNVDTADTADTPDNEDKADTADTADTTDTTDSSGSVKDEMEYQEVEYLEDEDLEDAKDTVGTDSSQLFATRKKRPKLREQDDAEQPKRKWPKKLPKAERLKTYKQYTEETFRKCMEEVRNSEITPQEASKKYNIPKKTICAKLTLDPKDVQIDNTTETELIENELRSRSPVSESEIAVDNEIDESYEPVEGSEEADEQQLPQTEEDDGTPEHNDMYKHKDNTMAVLQNSNATIIRDVGRNGYLCNFCEVHFATPRDLKIHNLKSHGRQVDKAVKTKHVSDLVIKLDITGLKCKLCKTSLDSLEKLIQHLNAVHSVLIHTDIKNYMIPFKFDTDEFKCVKCHKTFNYFYVLTEHMYEHCRNFKCTLCDRGFITKQALQTHSYKHKSGVFKCSYCSKVFETQPKRHEHMKSQHPTPSLYRKCEHCDERFQTWNQLVNHVRETHGAKPPVLACDECGKTCITQSSLKHHKTHFHLRQKPLKCPRCLKTFLSTTELHAHVKTHTKPREHVCKTCGKAFSSQFFLNKHARSHLEENQYVCDYCNRQFLHRTYFRSHMLKRHGEIV